MKTLEQIERLDNLRTLYWIKVTEVKSILREIRDLALSDDYVEPTFHDYLKDVNLE